jgi:cyclophilin family peptidyl-prolyl cis-trans isomerase
MMRVSIFLVIILFIWGCNPKISDGLRKKDLKKDVEMVTDYGTMVIRLSDSTPLHRDNFLKLVKQHYYDSLIFHRVIKNFMIQAGDPKSKNAHPDSTLGGGDVSYSIPAEFRASLFHKKGMVAAARENDAVNPRKESSGAQFYIVQGRKFTDAGLDSTETFRLKGRKLPVQHREVYKTIGGVPHLDQNYTVFGEVIDGLMVVDSIASVKTSGKTAGDRPLKDVYILKATLIRRK